MKRKVSNLIIYDNQSTPVFRKDLVGVSSDVYISTILPGGCNEVGLKVFAGKKLPNAIPDWMGFNFEMRVSDEEGFYWSGRLDDFGYGINREGFHWLAVARGFGVNLDDQYAPTVNVQNTAIETIVANAITNYTEQIDTTSITSTGVTISNVTAVNLKLMTAAQIIKWAREFGDISNAEQLMTVYPDDNATVRLTFKPKPSTYDLYAWVQDFDTVEGQLTGRLLANEALVQYNAGASTVSVADATLQGAGPAGWGLTRIVRLMMNEVTQVGDATQIANAKLTKHKTAKITAVNLQLKPQAKIRNANNQIVNPWRVRAGQTMRLVDFDVQQSVWSNLSFPRDFTIGETNWDDTSQVLTIVPESLELETESLLAKVYEVLEGRHSSDS